MSDFFFVFLAVINGVVLVFFIKQLYAFQTQGWVLGLDFGFRGLKDTGLNHVQKKRKR